MAGSLAALAGAAYLMAGARTDDQAVASPHSRTPALAPASTSPAHDLILGSKDSAQPKNMDEFLTAVTKDVDAYWTQVFKDSNLPEPRVSYDWIPAGQPATGACGGDSGASGDSMAAYCPGDDTIYISQKFATDVYNGTLDKVLPGSSQGYGRTAGDFAVAYMVAHEYGHQVQTELGEFDQYGDQLPTEAFELQADCYAGTWSKSVSDQNRLEDGDVQEALNAALAVGDFDTSNPQHHGTPEQRQAAWKTGFDSGDPSSCDTYLDPAGLGDSSGYPQDQQQVPGEDPTMGGTGV